MLREILISLRTRCAPVFVRLGYRHAAVACVARAARCAAAWRAHQEATRTHILSAMAEVPDNRDTAVIMGSGPCLDLPMTELLARFARVILVDVAHPPAALRLTRQHSAIELMERDLTGVAALLTDSAQTTLPQPACNAFVEEAGVGLVVSANLVSQLPLVPLRQAAKRWPDTDLATYAKAIVTAHLDHLRAFNCPTLLIGDVQRRVIAPDGQVTEMEDPLFGAELPAGEQEWDWTVAPVGELSNGWSIVNRVRALRIDQAGKNGPAFTVSHRSG
ncbi:hypothetical protein CHU95_17220 [Niveispirillum lacus]|uniref:Class I SAM-dependent methyltransferase n=1 Tax=Niveispirillum lacus TaxID=1981099 RepID=A0A255YTL3_9PROT|nr:hypothetical protein [Niveispirillum lacus]OYQ32529.1 hypothetical protein CHU95_17220 [Niveispirillum lacus]